MERYTSGPSRYYDITLSSAQTHRDVDHKDIEIRIEMKRMIPERGNGVAIQELNHGHTEVSPRVIISIVKQRD